MSLSVYNGTGWVPASLGTWDGTQFVMSGGGTITPPPDTPADMGAFLEAYLTEPTNYKSVVTVSGTGGTSIMDALLTCSNAIKSSAYDRHPADRGLVIIPPGTYNQRIHRQTTPGTIDIMSSTLDPADVIINAPDGTEDTLEIWGWGGIVAGLTLRATYPLAGATAAPIHNGTGAGSAEQFIFWRINAEVTNGQDALSWGANMGQSLFGYECNFGGSMYTHNFVAATSRKVAPTLVQWENCTASGLYRIVEETGDPGDTFKWRGGSLAAGWSFGYAYGATLATATWRGAIDPAAGTTGSTSTITQAVPTGMINPLTEDQHYLDYWFPDQRGVPGVKAVNMSGATKQALTANRAYFIPFTVDAAHNVSNVVTAMGTLAGSVGTSVHSDNAGKPSTRLRYNLTTAAATNTHGGGLIRTLVPGETYWLGVLLTNATATIDATTAIPAGARYVDTADGIIPATPAGTLAVTAGPVPAGTVNLL